MQLLTLATGSARHGMYRVSPNNVDADARQTIVATAIPRITDQFHSLDQVGWYGSAFFLTLATFQSTWGKAYKFFPLKTTFLAAVVVFELGSLICGRQYHHFFLHLRAFG